MPGQLLAVGLALGGLALLAGILLSRRIVASEDFARLQAAWERQAAFAADASHELRTPLSVVRSQAEVTLRRPRSLEEYEAALRTILEASGRMQELVEGLLVPARADQGIALGPVDLVPVVLRAVRDRSLGEGVAMRTDLPAHARLRGDARLLAIPVENLLSNAIRHTSAGAITARLFEEGGSLVLEVSDTGGPSRPNTSAGPSSVSTGSTRPGTGGQGARGSASRSCAPSRPSRVVGPRSRARSEGARRFG